jgi:Zn-dependent peptidase ImmA (M78 family)/fido (protein-threonine AMPylation protein)
MLDKEILNQYRNDAQGLAKYFSKLYFKDHEKVFPINPFQVLTDLGIHFVFRDFDKMEGLFMPSTKDMPIDLVAINAKRPITRQRFSAAHELCHFLKDADVHSTFMCAISSNEYKEKYAEAFASSFLMPEDELRAQVNLIHSDDIELTFDDVLRIADYFGTSFRACYYRIRSLFPFLIAYYPSKELNKYKPEKRRKDFGFSYTKLYEGLFDAWEDISPSNNLEFAKRLFKSKYVYNDARLEGVKTTYEAASEIIEDLQANRQTSEYCTETYEGFCNVAGHSVMYDFIFETAHDGKIDIYQLSTLNKKLFSCCPNPEYGGATRTDNVLVLGAKFETVDWRYVMPELIKLNNSVSFLESKASEFSRSQIVELIADIHHRITVIHPFPDGNGRTSRGFMIKMLIRYGMPPFHIDVERKEEYYNALEIADKENDFNALYEYIFKALIRAHVELATRPKTI